VLAGKRKAKREKARRRNVIKVENVMHHYDLYSIWREVEVIV